MWYFERPDVCCAVLKDQTRVVLRVQTCGTMLPTPIAPLSDTSPIRYLRYKNRKIEGGVPKKVGKKSSQNGVCLVWKLSGRLGRVFCTRLEPPSAHLEQFFFWADLFLLAH